MYHAKLSDNKVHLAEEGKHSFRINGQRSNGQNLKPAKIMT